MEKKRRSIFVCILLLCACLSIVFHNIAQASPAAVLTESTFNFGSVVEGTRIHSLHPGRVKRFLSTRLCADRRMHEENQGPVYGYDISENGQQRSSRNFNHGNGKYL